MYASFERSSSYQRPRSDSLIVSSSYQLWRCRSRYIDARSDRGRSCGCRAASPRRRRGRRAYSSTGSLTCGRSGCSTNSSTTMQVHHVEALGLRRPPRPLRRRGRDVGEVEPVERRRDPVQQLVLQLVEATGGRNAACTMPSTSAGVGVGREEHGGEATGGVRAVATRRAAAPATTRAGDRRRQHERDAQARVPPGPLVVDGRHQRRRQRDREGEAEHPRHAEQRPTPRRRRRARRRSSAYDVAALYTTPLPKPMTARREQHHEPSGPSGPTIASATIPTPSPPDPSASVGGAVRSRIMSPDSRAAERERHREREEQHAGLEHAGAADHLERGGHQHHHDPRAPVREGGRRRCRAGTAPSRVTRGRNQRVVGARAGSATTSEEPGADQRCRRSVTRSSQPPAAACWIPPTREPDAEHQRASRVSTGTERVRSAAAAAPAQQQHEGDRQQHDVHAEERAPRPRFGEEAGHERAARPRRCRRARPRSRPRPAASRPSNMASMAASDVVKQHADATPCNARPAIITRRSRSPRRWPTRSRTRPRRPAGSAGRRPGRRCDRSAAAARRTRGSRRSRSRPAVAALTPRSAPIDGSSTTTPFMSTDSATTGRLSANKRPSHVTSASRRHRVRIVDQTERDAPTRQLVGERERAAQRRARDHHSPSASS